MTLPEALVPDTVNSGNAALAAVADLTKFRREIVDMIDSPSVNDEI
jgi:hypothetical protein